MQQFTVKQKSPDWLTSDALILRVFHLLGLASYFGLKIFSKKTATLSEKQVKLKLRKETV